MEQRAEKVLSIRDVINAKDGNEGYADLADDDLADRGNQIKQASQGLNPQQLAEREEDLVDTLLRTISRWVNLKVIILQSYNIKNICIHK